MAADASALVHSHMCDWRPKKQTLLISGETDACLVQCRMKHSGWPSEHICLYLLLMPMFLWLCTKGLQREAHVQSVRVPNTTLCLENRCGTSAVAKLKHTAIAYHLRITTPSLPHIFNVLSRKHMRLQSNSSIYFPSHVQTTTKLWNYKPIEVSPTKTRCIAQRNQRRVASCFQL